MRLVTLSHGCQRVARLRKFRRFLIPHRCLGAGHIVLGHVRDIHEAHVGSDVPQLERVAQLGLIGKVDLDFIDVRVGIGKTKRVDPLAGDSVQRFQAKHDAAVLEQFAQSPVIDAVLDISVQVSYGLAGSAGSRARWSAGCCWPRATAASRVPARRQRDA